MTLLVGTGCDGGPRRGNLPRDQALKTLQNNSFHVTVRERRDPRIPAGLAIETVPPAGAVAAPRRGRRARRQLRPLNVSGGAFDAVLPCLDIVLPDDSARSLRCRRPWHGRVGESRPVPFATRPVLQGTLGMVAAGHYLAAAIGLQPARSRRQRRRCRRRRWLRARRCSSRRASVSAARRPILIHLANQRTQRGHQRPGLGAARGDHRLVSPARHQPDPVRRLPAGDRPRPVRRLVHRAAAVRHRLAGGRARAVGRHGRGRFPGVRRAAQRRRASVRDRYFDRVADVGRDLPAQRPSRRRGRR